MQKCAAGEDRQGLVGRIGRYVRTQKQGMQGGGQEGQMGAMGVVHQKGDFLFTAEGRKGRDVAEAAVVIGAGYVDGPYGRLGSKEAAKPVRPDATVGPRIEPAGLGVQQGAGVDGRPMGAAVHGNPVAGAEGQGQHGLDGQGTAPRRKEGGFSAE